MRRAAVCTFLALLLSLSAAYISFQLLARHLTGAPGPAWFDAGCSDDPESTANCGAVLASPYSYWPAKHEGAPEGQKHLPVALLGLFYYSALVVWLLGVGAPSHSRRYLHLIPLAFIACGLLASINYMYVMFAKLDHWCVWCLATHGMNAAIAVLAIMMWPRSLEPEGAGPSSRSESRARVRDRGVGGAAGQGVGPGVAHPSFRLVAMTSFAALALVWGQYHLYDKANFRSVALYNKNAFNQCRAMIDKLKSEPANLLASWKNGETCPIPLRPDDAIRTDAAPGEPSLEVVAFSDLECPSCKRFAVFFERDVQQLFDHKLSLVFRHHPLNSECNPRVARTMHPHACEAARLAEAARVLGGAEKFWLAHDLLFRDQAKLEKGNVSTEWFAQRVGVSVDELEVTMASPEIMERIQQDIGQATSCNVRATPTVFVDGKLVDTIARSEIKFWDQLADSFWAGAGLPRPEHTRLSAKSATQDNQGRTAGQ